MQVVGEELKRLIDLDNNWDGISEGIRISTPHNDFSEEQITDDAIDLRILNRGYVMNSDYEFINTLSKERFDNHFQQVTLPFDGYILQPGEILYIGTVERICLKGPYIGRISGRSTYARLGLSISSSQDKFCGHNDAIVCLQLRNNSKQGLKIYPYQKLVQIMFYKTLGTPGAKGSPYADEVVYTLPQIGEKERHQYDRNTAESISKLPSRKRNLIARGLAKLKNKKDSIKILNILLGAVFTSSSAIVNFFAINNVYKATLCILFFASYMILSIALYYFSDPE